MKKSYFIWICILFISLGYSQGKITGKILDSDLNQGLPGVNISIKGTTLGTTTDFDGNFSITSDVSSGELQINFIGYESQTIKFDVFNNQTINIGNIVLKSDSNELDEVVIVGKGIIDLAKDRKTPIAVSSIKAAEIQSKIGTSDITQTLVNTPSVYVAGQAGGFGDSRISVR